MAARTPKSILMAVVLWVVILAGAATAVRYFALPEYLREKRNRLASQTGSEGETKTTVRLAADSFSGYCVLRSEELARRLGAEGIRLTILDDGADYMARIKALSRGEVEMAVFPINSFIQCGVKLGEFPASIVYLVDETQGADAILAHKQSVPGIASLNSRDARIVVTPDSPSEFLARVLISSFNLPLLPEKGWMIKVNGSDEAYKKFRGETGGKPVAYAMWEPDVSRALRETESHVLLDSSKVKGYIVDVLVVRREFFVEHYDTARSVVENYARAAYAWQANMVELVMEDAKAAGHGMERSDALHVVQGIAWKNVLENYAHFGLQDNAHALESIEEILTKVTDVLVKTGALAADPLGGGVNNLYFNKLVKELKDRDFHPGRDVDIITDMEMAYEQEPLRGPAKLAPLNEAQWKALAPVGELRVRPLTFGRGTDRLSVQSRHDLETLARTLNSWPQYYLTVTGRVRPGGDETAAMQLAGARAETVLRALVEQGVAPERIRALAEIGALDGTESQSVTFVFGKPRY